MLLCVCVGGGMGETGTRCWDVEYYFKDNFFPFLTPYLFPYHLSCAKNLIMVIFISWVFCYFIQHSGKKKAWLFQWAASSSAVSVAKKICFWKGAYWLTTQAYWLITKACWLTTRTLNLEFLNKYSWKTIVLVQTLLSNVMWYLWREKMHINK